MEPIVADVRMALRRLWHAPGFTLFAVASLALGIGTAMVVYSGVRTLMWQPTGVPRAGELMSIRNAASWPDFEDLRRRQTSFRAIAASTSRPVAVGAGHGSQTVFAELVTGDYFTVVGVRPRLGRLLNEPDESTGARVAVVSEYFWKANLGGDPGVIGRPIKLGGETFELVGVIDGPFHGLTPFFPQALWLPITAAPRASGAFGFSSRWFEQRSVSVVSVWGRVARSGETRQAATEVALIARQLDETYPNPAPSAAPRRWVVYADAASPPDNDTRDTVVFMIFAGIAMVLLIACTNLANLALARETSRAQETAVRSALGASRWRLVREQLIEGAFVVAVGGSLGVACALLFVDYEAVDIPFAPGVAIRFPQVDYSIVVAGLGAMTIALAVFGLWPALQSTRADVRSALGAGGGATAPKWRLHRTIIAWQVCGSVALLLVALLSVRVITAAAGRQAAPTAHADLALAQIDFALNGQDEAHMRVITASILDEMRAHQSVRAVAAANGLPFGWITFRTGERAAVTTEASAARPHDEGMTSVIIAATPSFLTATGTALLRGRAFNDQDDAAAPPVAIVNEQAARALFRTIDVVGRTIYVPRAPGSSAAPPSAARPAAETPSVATRIVGVCVNDEPWISSGSVDGVVFEPFSQRYVMRAPVTLLARGGATAADVRALRASIRAADPDLAVAVAGAGSVLLDGPLLLVRLIVAVTTAMGTLALVLSMAGLFGVLSHLVAKRTREIGVRLALGAERADIVRLILRDGFRPVTKGLVLGLAIGAAARVAVKTFVVTDVSSVDPLPLLVLPVPFLIAALIASYLPAARASRVDPNVALRDL
jgi:predicted permease